MFSVSFSIRSRLFSKYPLNLLDFLRSLKNLQNAYCSVNGNKKNLNRMFKIVHLKVQLVNQVLCGVEILLFLCRLHNGRLGKSSNKSNSNNRKTSRGQRHHRSTPSDQQGAASKQQQPMNVAPPSANQIEQKAQENENYKREGNTREGQATRSKPKNLIRPERASLREQKQPCERSEHPDECAGGWRAFQIQNVWRCCVGSVLWKAHIISEAGIRLPVNEMILPANIALVSTRERKRQP